MMLGGDNYKTKGKKKACTKDGKVQWRGWVGVCVWKDQQAMMIRHLAELKGYGHGKSRSQSSW